MNRKELADILQWQIDAGVNLTFGDKSALADLKKQKKDNSVVSQNYQSPPKPVMQTQEKSSFQNFMESKTPSYKPNSDNMKDNSEFIEEAIKSAESCSNLDELKKVVESFEGLSIKKLAKNCVFGEGNTESNLMLIGEAPGQNEDEEGRPFCGVSGRLLDKLFKFVGYQRAGEEADNSFYITNTVFWRPPGNRKPLPEEIAMCKPFVEKHIALINPKAIVLVGGTAIESVLGITGSVTKLRKNTHKYYNKELSKEIDCFVIYHPSYLLRQPTQKKNAWGDMLKIKKYIDNL